MVTEREKRARDKERHREQREADAKRVALEDRMLSIKTSFPSAEARTKEALKCPHADYPEMEAADLQKKLHFFDISQHMYYQFKRKMDVAVAVASAQASLDSKIRAHENAFEESLQEESAVFSRGDDAQLREHILSTLHVSATFSFCLLVQFV
jgi:hypothetical protein